MSGIGGLTWLDGRKDFDDAALLQRFTSALRPYGTTRQETLVSPACALVYAHCAGSCIHDQAAAPTSSADGRFRLVFDGRLDYREELIEQLGLTAEALDWTDARLAAESWSRWADDAPRHWYGEFAVIAWDNKQNQLFLVRDHLGMRSLSWHREMTGWLLPAPRPSRCSALTVCRVRPTNRRSPINCCRCFMIAGAVSIAAFTGSVRPRSCALMLPAIMSISIGPSMTWPCGRRLMTQKNC
jgi:hypothetical protein